MPLNSQAVHVCFFYPPWKQIIPLLFIMCKLVLLFNPERKAFFKNSLSSVFSVLCTEEGDLQEGKDCSCNGGTLAHGWFVIIL